MKSVDVCFKRYKKGFTLIELLAVIVILAIIAIIATPIVLNIIKDSRDSATLQSANFYLSAVENSIAQEEDVEGKLKNTNCEILENKSIKCEGYDKEIIISINGEVPGSGTITLQNKKISAIKLYYGDKLIIKDKNNKLIYAEETFKQVKDSNPAIICGESEKEDLNQSTCYIKSIEDLVAFTKLINAKNTFSGKTVELVYNLDFNNKNSYASRKINESLITGTGFVYAWSAFSGIFDGKDKIIKGLYINSPTSQYVGLFANLSSGTIQNLTLENANITAHRYSGSLVGNNNKGTIKNVSIKSIQVTGSDYFVGGVVGSNSGTISNIFLEDINVSVSSGKHYAGGLTNSNSGVIKNIIGNNINVKAHGNSGGLTSSNSGTITQVKLTNVNLNGQQVFGGLVGINSSGSITNSKIEANINVNQVVGLAIGQMQSGEINTVVTKGTITANNTYIGGLVGRVNASSQETAPTISGVYLSGLLNCTANSTRNRIVGATGTYLQAMNALASSSITIGGNTIESTDITSKHGKTLDDMGIASKSEYEALGFEFNSTDENEAYWYFDENDELDLFIKGLEK